MYIISFEGWVKIIMYNINDIILLCQEMKVNLGMSNNINIV